MKDTQQTTAKPTPTATGLWGNVKLAARRKFDWKGRSTRAEFWSYTAFYLIICLSLLALFILPLIQIFSLDLDDKSNDAAVIGWLCLGIVLLAVLAIVTLLLGIPWIAVLLRRLHDLGKKGWSILVAVILDSLSVSGTVLVIRLLSISDYHAIGPVALIIAWILAIPVAIGIIAAFVVNLVIFINCLRPGQRIDNAFGAPAR